MKIKKRKKTMQLSKKLIVYFALAYFLSWLIFVPLALNKQGLIFLFTDDAAHARTQDVWHAFGGFGPFLSAMLTTFLFHGRKGFRIFFNAYSLKKLNFKGWLLALSPVFLLFVSVLIAKFVNGEWLSFSKFFQNNHLLNGPDLLIWFFPLLTYGFGEEGGWRGYALPQLQSKYSALTATIILSFFWLGWHIPSFFYRYQLSGGMLIGFMLGLFAGAILMTFIYNYTKGSLLAVSLWHFAFNLVSMIGTPAVVAASMSTIVMVLAAFVVIRYGKKDLSPFPKISYLFEIAKDKINEKQPGIKLKMKTHNKVL
jgi:membrane protease YdiL (CAAX protease family)